MKINSVWWSSLQIVNCYGSIQTKLIFINYLFTDDDDDDDDDCGSTVHETGKVVNFILVSLCMFHSSLFKNTDKMHFTFLLLYINRPLHMFRFYAKTTIRGFRTTFILHPMLFLPLYLCNILVCKLHSLLNKSLKRTWRHWL